MRACNSVLGKEPFVFGKECQFGKECHLFVTNVAGGETGGEGLVKLYIPTF